MSSAQVKNSFTGIGEIGSEVLPSTLVLKLGAYNGALRYFVCSATHRRVLFYGQYALHHVADDDDLAKRLTRIFEKDEVLQLPFKETIVGFDTRYQLLPIGFEYLKNNNQLLQLCPSAGIGIAFNIPPVIHRIIQQVYRKPVFVHLASTLITALPAYIETLPDALFVNISEGHFDVLRLKPDGSVLLMNRYEYKTETDFAYFLLLCCEEIGINREKTSLILLGEVTEKSKIYNICYRYFSNISFIEPPDGLSFAREFDEYPRHLHFNLYNLNG